MKSPELGEQEFATVRGLRRIEFPESQRRSYGAGGTLPRQAAALGESSDH